MSALPSFTSQKLKIGLFGGGTVGGGVYQLLNQGKSQLNALQNHAEIVKICVRDLKKPRDFQVSSSCVFVQDYDAILKDTSINCVIELIGGVTDAKKIVFEAIRAGKHVITANKALIASHMKELDELLQQHPTVKFGYEAAVCGGIPIIHSLQSDFSGDKITEVAGIMNGTTNYMLSKMENSGVSYDDVLKEAQDLGFAEANPSADVDGFDVQSKIAILAKLAFGCTIAPSVVPTKGITTITENDFEYAKMMNSTVKLLGVARRLSDTKISVFVSPVLVSRNNVIATIGGATNLANVISENLVASAYVGQGAGRYPTANSVVSDISRISSGLCPYPFPNEVSMQLETDYEARFYVRIRIKDQVGVIRVVGGIAEESGVSIYSILQAPIVDRSNTYFAVTTDITRLSQVQSMCQAIGNQNFALEEPLFMPIME